MQPLLFAAWFNFDGHWVTILTHPFAVIWLAYVVPLTAIAVLAKGFNTSVPGWAWFLGKLQWLGTADPNGTAALQAEIATLQADIAEIKQATVTKPPTQ